jgi:ribosomal protein S18 acetylase RimI-like enzyme
MDTALVPFALSFVGSVRRWALESPFSPWASPPSTEDLRGALADPEVAAYVLLERERPVAYGEIWSESSSDEIELARIIVDPNERRRGLGTALVRGLIDIARQRVDAPVWVRVLPDNIVALACYAKLGFGRTSPDEELRFNQEGQSPGMKWMLLARA